MGGFCSWFDSRAVLLIYKLLFVSWQHLEDQWLVFNLVFLFHCILVVTSTGKVFPVTVKGSDTIGEIKLKIQAKEHIPIHQQELFFKQNVPKYTNINLASLPIKESTHESAGFMNIFIKNLEGRIIYFFEVKPSDTIGNVKAKIMSGSGHVLMFNDVALEDNGTLADFHIVTGSILTCVDKADRKMEIFVNTFTRKTISLLVTPTDTIENVKLSIFYEERIPVDEQGLMQIFIKTFSEGVITVEVNPSYTIGNIKSKIQDKIHIPHDEQELIFNEVVLDNIDTIADSNINEESTLTLVRKSTGHMHIFIKVKDGQTINMKLKPSDTVYNVRSKIANHEGVPRRRLMLLFNGRGMIDGLTLADYHILEKSTIDSMIRFP
ncbi:putative Ubiquitin-like domain-containing protein [Helianthus annuus]|nr:putative Ubiquitin-like domain-containing protein [Helianthus annuus]KAJ0793691.1 putative Ubiquitin-like domain-containing protein [Helianthus annuus]KAJ0958273.1 putative Ubiquitin domain-containing protein [Helianthus annuus]